MCIRDRFNQRSCEHEVEIEILGVGIHGFAGDLDGAIEHPCFAVGFHLAFIAAKSSVSAHIDHLLVSSNGQIGLVLFVIDSTQAL